MATGFNNTPPASEFHRHSSWGRTRQPKNIAGPHKTMLHDGSTTPPTVLPTGAPSAATDGYRTENQRFLHIMLTNDANAHTHSLKVWGYSHASGQWGALYDVSGNAVEITKTNQACDEYYIFEVAGVDRVYFQATATQYHSDDRIAAAMSTF